MRSDGGKISQDNGGPDGVLRYNEMLTELMIWDPFHVLMTQHVTWTHDMQPSESCPEQSVNHSSHHHQGSPGKILKYYHCSDDAAIITSIIIAAHCYSGAASLVLVAAVLSRCSENIMRAMMLIEAPFRVRLMHGVSLDWSQLSLIYNLHNGVLLMLK